MIKRFFLGVAGSLLFRLPFWIIAAVALRSGALPTLCNWDCGIYSYISPHYVAADAAFFPLFPLLVHATSVLLPFLSPESAVVVASNLFVPLAGALFLFLCDSLWAGELKTGKIAGFFPASWLALLLLSVFPEGHFWMRGYSEPVFFALLTAILLSLKHERWLIAGACTGLIAVTRPQGVWVDAIVGPYLLARYFLKERSNARLAASVILCGLPFLAFMAWLWAKTGNPIYFYAAQHGWGRKFDFLAGLKDQLPRWDASHLYLYLGLWAAIRFIRRPSLEWKVIGMLSLAFSELPVFFGGFFSYVRFASVNPALFLLGSELIFATGRPRGRPTGRTRRWVVWAVTVAVVLWSIIRLAIQVRLAGSTWVG